MSIIVQLTVYVHILLKQIDLKFSYTPKKSIDQELFCSSSSMILNFVSIVFNPF